MSPATRECKCPMCGARVDQKWTDISWLVQVECEFWRTCIWIKYGSSDVVWFPVNIIGVTSPSECDKRWSALCNTATSSPHARRGTSAFDVVAVLYDPFMSLSSAVYTLWVFWVVVYGVHRLIQHKSSTETVLPLHQRRRSSDWHITIRFLRARVETSKWNTAHDKLSTKLKRGGGSWSRMWLGRFYTLGFVSGVIGMVVVFGLLLWTAWTLVRPFSIHKIGIPKIAGKLMKRDSFGPAPESPITPIVRMSHPFRVYHTTHQLTRAASRCYSPIESRTRHHHRFILEPSRP